MTTPLKVIGVPGMLWWFAILVLILHYFLREGLPIPWRPAAFFVGFFVVS